MDYQSDYSLQEPYVRLKDYNWSPCSVEDFTKFYSEEVYKKGMFCLEKRHGKSKVFI
jgi:hypothetical protein